MPLKPWIDKDNFNAGYMMRSLHLMPQQGTAQPWQLETDYWVERDLLPVADLKTARCTSCRDTAR